MSKTIKLTKDVIIERSNLIHNNFYDYSQMGEYVNNRTKIKIICPIHGEFYQVIKDHINGRGCKVCGILKNTGTNEKFIERSNIIHNNFYDYSLVEYENSYTKVKIICPSHGVFEQTPHSHLKGYGCVKCSKLETKTTECFISQVKKIHNNFYDYSLVEYINSYTKVKIICPVHGSFNIRPNSHLHGSGCKKCGGKFVFNTIDFINRSNIIHNNKYDYSLVNYINNKTKVKIICSVHGIFEQRPNYHLLGKGCSMCNLSKGEIKIKNYLEFFNIKYVTEKTFNNCKNKNKLRFDFYLPDYNTCIEFDGEQHFIEIKGFGGNEKLLYTQKNDNIKTEYCLNNNIQLIRIKYDENILEKLKTILPS